MPAPEARELFGGAASTVLPLRFVDISLLRQVPDNQEAFVDCRTDDSVVVELLELHGDVSGDEIPRFHFVQVAEHNEASDSIVHEVRRLEPSAVPRLPPTAECYLLRGSQRVAKFNERVLNNLHLYLCVLRLPHVSTDVVVTYNHPAVASPTESGSRGADEDPDVASGRVVLETAIREFRVHDWGLFG